MFDTKLFCLQRERGGLGRKMGSIGDEAVSLFFFFSFFCKASAVSQTSGCKGKGRRKGPNHSVEEESAVLR